MPHAEINCYPGRTEEKKKQCAEKIAQDIAEILGCSPNAATIRCCRARKALRDLLDGNMQESGRQ